MPVASKRRARLYKLNGIQHTIKTYTTRGDGYISLPKKHHRVAHSHARSHTRPPARTIVEPSKANNDHISHKKTRQHKKHIDTQITGENNMRPKQCRQIAMFVEESTGTVQKTVVGAHPQDGQCTQSVQHGIVCRSTHQFENDTRKGARVIG